MMSTTCLINPCLYCYLIPLYTPLSLIYCYSTCNKKVEQNPSRCNALFNSRDRCN